MATYVFDAYGTLYDVQSVSEATDAAFPGRGPAITQIWRLKQLEYTWLRGHMGQYQDFWQVTRESLDFALQGFGLSPDAATVDRVLDKFLHLLPYPEAKQALAGLKTQGHTLAILSNGSPKMLDDLVRNTGLDSLLDRVISVDAAKTFKPSPKAYALVEAQLGVAPAEVVFISSNNFDVAGAKAFGFTVHWIRRMAADAITADIAADPDLGPTTLFKLLRLQPELLGFPADREVGKLTDLLTT